MDFSQGYIEKMSAKVIAGMISRMETIMKSGVKESLEIFKKNFDSFSRQYEGKKEFDEMKKRLWISHRLENAGLFFGVCNVFKNKEEMELVAKEIADIYCDVKIMIDKMLGGEFE